VYQVPAPAGHEPTRSACPACLATLNEVTLSWGSAWVVLEECPRCGMLALDEGEVEALALLASEGPPGELPTPAEGEGPVAEAWLRAIKGAATLFELLGEGLQ